MTTPPDRCSEIVRTFDAQGWHRTATDGDAAASAWLIEELKAYDCDPHVQPFPFRRLDVERCRVALADVDFDAIPLADSELPMGDFTISGALSERAGRHHVAATRANHQGADPAFEEIRRGSWAAIVAAVGDPAMGPALRNAACFAAPYGAPAFQVSATAWPRLAAALAAGAEVRVSGSLRRTATEATNVVARVRGRDSLRPLAVLTPKSGWWHCAGERGGGIAVFLELARALANEPLRRDVVFVATTGHELGFLGIRRFFEAHPSEASNPVAWLHLGANIGAAGTETVIRAGDAALHAAVSQAVAVSAANVAPTLHLTPRPPGGEGAVVAEFGGRFVSVVGKDFRLFHSIDDRWPHAIDPDAIAGNARLMLEILHALDEAPSDG